MNYFRDKKLKKIAQNEKITVPKNYYDIVEKTLEDLPESNENIKNTIGWKYSFNFAVAMIMAFMFILPNISPQVAYAMQEIPVIGDFVKVITIRNYFEKEGNSELEIEVPKIEENEESKADKIVNEEIEKLVQRIMNTFNEEKNPENHLFTQVKYDVIENNEDWFTLRLEISQIAGSSDLQYKYYHIDKKTDKVVKLGDLFKDEEYKTVISKEIKRQMIERMKQNSDVTYWVDECSEEWSFCAINDDTNFYFSKDGNIIIVFDKYEVGPGATGTPEFEIPKKIYEDYLK